MNILVSGATGLVGTELCNVLKGAGHSIVRLTRDKQPKAGEVFWNPLAGILDPGALNGIDAAVHLAGENIAGRWTDAKKKAILESRVSGTRTLSEALAKMNTLPKTLVCASAIGFYGQRGAEGLTEASAPGTGFLADVCKAWEAAADPARKAGIRVSHARLGVLLSPKGGALKQMLFPFKMGVGGVIGDGKQYMSWMALDDAVQAFAFILKNAELSGPVNVVAPNPVTNREFTKTLGKVLSRPTILPMPAFAARLAFGEMADDLLLGSTRVVPERLQKSNYEFKHPQLEEALRSLLQK
jgi:uncharacterized protein (TIGR01777 family)